MNESVGGKRLSQHVGIVFRGSIRTLDPFSRENLNEFSRKLLGIKKQFGSQWKILFCACQCASKRQQNSSALIKEISLPRSDIFIRPKFSYAVRFLLFSHFGHCGPRQRRTRNNMLKKTFDDKQIKLSEMSPTHKQRTQTGQQPSAQLTKPRPKLNCLFSVPSFSY